MTNNKELIQSFTKDDYENKKVNLHIHTRYSDGQAEPEEIVRQAKEKGFKKIAICDHNTVGAYLNTNILNEDIIIPAVEFDAWCGYIFMHLLGYGIDVYNKELKYFYAKTKKETEADAVRIFAKRDIKSLIQAIHNAGGIAVLAHPANCWALNMDKFIRELMSYGLDGLEVYYPYERHRGFIKFHTSDYIEKLADKYSLIKTGGTDLHTKIL